MSIVPILKSLAHPHTRPQISSSQHWKTTTLLLAAAFLAVAPLLHGTAQNCTAFMQKPSFQRSNETRNDKARSLYLMAANLKPTSLPTSKRSEDCIVYTHTHTPHDTSSLSQSSPRRKNNLRQYPQQQEQHVEIKFIHGTFGNHARNLVPRTCPKALD